MGNIDGKVARAFFDGSQGQPVFYTKEFADCVFASNLQCCQVALNCWPFVGTLLASAKILLMSLLPEGEEGVNAVNNLI